ncbi:RNA polymerase sigma factor [Anaerotruncus colihominis]|uniref:Sigma-70 family RNA polymerase sigma factor n=1 Tax=Anaerotruncus colihominis TaxID=169435 RepID=A0A845SV39_9FIRM|nr:sigma-70 family RNA polymerase sigma factor [Anaerotruncus colihominis]MCR2026032.1 sigma-70 family RNA polymerase sigma factor [Anaerotruncus colihominis]NDO37807.1 sigma-70 family RNA polymerase sigma factor [Anaerotruncus colihominis]
MTVINLKRYYYPLVKTDVFVEVPDEIADALLHLRREENNRKSKMFYHKAYFSLDCEDGIENDAIGWAQPSPEDYMIQAEDEAAQELLLEHLWEAIGQLTPTQARRLHMRYMLEMKYREIAEAEGISPTQASDSVRRAVKKLQKYFKKRKWTREGL